MEKINHPALKMDDMSLYAETEDAPEAKPETETAAVPAAEEKTEKTAAVSTGDIEQIKKTLESDIRASVTREVVSSIIDVLSEKFLGVAAAKPETPKRGAESGTEKSSVKASERIGAIKSFEIPKEKSENPVWTVKLGNTKDEGGSRGVTYHVGGADCMPFHLWEGAMPHRPLIAMEVFDKVSEKYPQILRDIYGELLNDPAEMAKICVDKYGADLISVRLDSTHPERGNSSAQDAAALVGKILKAVPVPLIITGHNSYDKNNEVMKTVAQAYEGENLLFNWVEQDNYKTIAGAVMAYGHSVVAQSPIDVNIGKQLNILMTNMGLQAEKIVMDPMTSSIGYGIEYTYSVMERIRQTGLGGDKLLCAPLIASVGQECAKIKEFKAPEESFPNWGNLKKRAVNWELSTATTLLYAGADILIMYHPEAAEAAKRVITRLMEGEK